MEEYTKEYVQMWQRWNDFDGKSNIKEFWMAVLINFIVSVLLGIVGNVVGFDLLGGLYGLAVIIPFVALAIRRLHDTGRSGWYLLWWFLPFIGWIILILAWIKPSE